MSRKNELTIRDSGAYQKRKVSILIALIWCSLLVRIKNIPDVRDEFGAMH